MSTRSDAVSRSRLLVLLCLALLAAGCRPQETDRAQPLFEPLAPSETGVAFVNAVEESPELNVITFESFYNGAGVGIGDVDGDGLQDVFLASNMGQSRLYRNLGDLRFEDVTGQAGIGGRGKWANGVSMVDLNGDGRLDIYVCYGGPYADAARRANELYINLGDGTFAERAEAFGLADTGVTTQAAFLDYDGDGDLDVYLLTNGTGNVGPNVIVPKKTRGQAANTDRLYRNEGDGTFTDVSAAAGILIDGYGLGVAATDIDGDGWTDVYVANDYLSNDLLYINNGDGTFTDRAAEYFRHQSYAAMGTDVADFNNDGRPDVVTVDMLPADPRRVKRMYGDAGYDRHRSERLAGYDPQVRRNTLQLNGGRTPAGRPSFVDVAPLAGIHATEWSWSALFADFDNDGWRDLLVTNGLPRDITNLDFSDYKMRQLTRRRVDGPLMRELVEALGSLEGFHVSNYLFKNNGDLTFSDVSTAWGFGEPSYSTGAAYGDLDNDGDLDLVLNNVDEPASVYRNNARGTTGGRYLQVELKGPAGNPAGLGARVSIHHGGASQYHDQAVHRGYLSTVTSTIHFGIGRAASVDSVVVLWPDARRQVVAGVSPDQRLEVRYAPAAPRVRRTPAEPGGRGRLFAGASKALGDGFQHVEQHYDDFKVQPLLPHKFSQSGPGLAVGDVNGDGRDDFYVGGAFEQSGRVYLQRPGGTFVPADGSAGLATQVSGLKNYEEDAGALFFDADGDGHLDLYVVSGGSEFAPGAPYYQDRLYRGDGSGQFRQEPGALPRLTASGSAVVAGDFDADGDLDLFVGGRVVPTQYPTAPESYLLENRGGVFVDVTADAAPSLAQAGMVTAALWTDFNDDGQLDLIVVGEWMPVTFFENRGGRFDDVTERLGMANTVGWWNSITAADFDRDGDTDYAAGNLGLNTPLRNRPEGPVRMHAADFNRDGRMDAVISRFVGGKSYPVHLRDDLLAQLPSMQQRFPSYASYAGVEMEDLLREDERAGMMVRQIDVFETSYIENEGGAAFSVTPLPVRAQLAPVFGVVSGDYDGDGLSDLLMVGNSLAAESFSGPYDAFSGTLLRGDGRGGFEPVDGPASGFFVDGDAKSLAAIVADDGGRMVLAARNGAALEAFRSSVPEGSTVLRARPDEVRAEIRFTDGAREKAEFYYGGGYLSQSSRALLVPAGASEVTLYTAQGASRTWTAPSALASAAR